MPTHWTQALPAIGMLAVLALGYTRVISARAFFTAGFWAGVIGAIVLFASPTFPGYWPELSEHRFGGQSMAVIGPRIAGMCFAICGTCALCGFGFRRTRSAA